MKHSSRPQTISWFQEHYKLARLKLRPPFQRKPVWSDKQRCALIESILMDVPIPEIYVQVTQTDDGQEEYGVVDGQQRLRTILQFVGVESAEDQEDDNDHNNFVLDALPATSTHKGKSFADVTGEARKQFFRYEVCVRFLYTDEQSEIEDVFKRLNKFLMPLKAQELRNATYHGPFARLSESLADDDYWAVNKIVRAAAIRRMADIEMMSDLLIGLMHGPQGGSAKVIDQYYEINEPFEDEFPDQNRVEILFGKIKGAIQRLFPVFSDVRWGNRADFYSLFVALGDLLKEHDLPKKNDKDARHTLVTLGREIDAALESPSAKASSIAKKYARAIEKGSNDRARRLDRHEVLRAVLLPFVVDKK